MPSSTDFLVCQGQDGAGVTLGSQLEPTPAAVQIAAIGRDGWITTFDGRGFHPL